jgi:multiple sugar transport system permease protein
MKKSRMVPWIFLSPFIISLGIFFVYSAARAIIFSFTDYDMFNDFNFVGFSNYIELFNKPLFLYALRNTLVYALLVTSIQTFLALILASVLTAKIKGINFFRVGFYLPSVTSSVVISVIFLWLFQRKGVLNYVLSGIKAFGPTLLIFLLISFVIQFILYKREIRKGMPAKPWELSLLLVSFMISFIIVFLLKFTGIIPPMKVLPVDIVWLQTRETFLGVPIPLWAIMIQNIFTTIPTLMLIFLAGLQDVSPSLYEAARIDGANSRVMFFNITIPAIRPVLFLVLTLSLIGTLQMFEQVAIYGDAVPLQSVVTLAYFVYNRMFAGGILPQVGMAAAAAMFLAFITIVAVLLQRLVVKSEVEK